MRAKFINEKLISDVKISDVVNKKTIDEWLSDSFFEELFISQYAYEEGHNLEEIEEDENFLESEDFNNWLRYELEVLSENIIYKFETDIINDNKISIWRVITVEDNWLEHLEKQGKRLGIYWSWDEQAAEAHGGHNTSNIEAAIESEIDVSYVDWEDTIKLNINPSYSDEKEVRLFKNTPLKIISIMIDGKKIDITNIKNKIFKA